MWNVTQRGVIPHILFALLFRLLARSVFFGLQQLPRSYNIRLISSTLGRRGRYPNHGPNRVRLRLLPSCPPHRLVVGCAPKPPPP